MLFFGVNIGCGYKTIGIISTVTLVTTSVFGFLIVPMAINSKLKGLNLKSGSERRKMWEKSVLPITFNVYVFNITNPMDVVNGEKPHLHEIGPYVFEEWKDKKILSENDEEDSVTFEMINTYYFRPDLTRGLTGDEVVTVPHPILMGGLIALQRDTALLLGIGIKAFTQIFEPDGSPLLTIKVMDFLFNGIAINCDHEDMEAQIVCPTFSERKGVKQVNDTFYTLSMLGGGNGTSIGKFKVNRGIKDYRRVGEVIELNDNEELEGYKGKCNIMLGTDGSIFAPFHKKKESYYSVSSALCSSLEFSYMNDSYYNGVPVSSYNVNFGVPEKDPEPNCFCRKGDPEKCTPKGTIDNYPCSGVPLVISKPHFLDADESLIKSVVGLKPDRSIHDNYFKFELKTSSPLSLRNRNQFSLQIEQIPSYDLMAKIRPIIFPMFWFEEAIDLPKEATNIMRNGIYLFQTITNVVKYLGLIFGIAGVGFAGYMIYGDSISKNTAFLNRPQPVQNPVI